MLENLAYVKLYIPKKISAKKSCISGITFNTILEDSYNCGAIYSPFYGCFHQSKFLEMQFCCCEAYAYEVNYLLACGRLCCKTPSLISNMDGSPILRSYFKFSRCVNVWAACFRIRKQVCLIKKYHTYLNYNPSNALIRMKTHRSNPWDVSNTMNSRVTSSALELESLV